MNKLKDMQRSTQIPKKFSIYLVPVGLRISPREHLCYWHHQNVSIPSKNETSIQCCTNVGPPSTTLAQHWYCCTNVGPPSTTLAQHWYNVGSMSLDCWVLPGEHQIRSASTCSSVWLSLSIYTTLTQYITAQQREKVTPVVGLMLARRRRRRANINPTCWEHTQTYAYNVLY